MRTVTVPAPAKINLTLDITGRRADGYHLLCSVMLGVDLCDTLTLTRCAGDSLRLTCDDPLVPLDESNLVHRAYLAFLQAAALAPFGLHAHIEKRIPMEAGLAGGSADAAAALRGLNVLCDAPLPFGLLQSLAPGLGADVPFCLLGGCALAGGVGETLEPLPLPAGAALVLAKPSGGVSTAAAFAHYDALEGPIAHPDSDAAVRALRAGDLRALGAAMGNVLERVAGLPDIPHLKRQMLDHGALGAAMTGSGSAVVGLFDDKADAVLCADALQAEGVAVWQVAPHPQKIMIAGE